MSNDSLEPATPSAAEIETWVRRVAERLVESARPRTTYRFQLHREFGFADVQRLLPYLKALGISDVYLSPYLQAVEGSQHGYDVVDHQTVNVEMGGEAALAELHRALKEQGMGQLFDVVPNHMGIGQSNPLWMDLLENGPSAAAARTFDVDWAPIKDELQGKLLLPILGDQYGIVLEQGELQLELRQGTFLLHYGDQRLPIEPASSAVLLGHRLPELATKLGADSEPLQEIQSLLTALGNLPGTDEQDTARRTERVREKEIVKRRLAALCDRSPEVATFLQENLRQFNGDPKDPRSYDPLDRLLDRQVYRLAHWRVAGEEINYRRFFDVNQLAAIRVEDLEVFEETHRRLFAWLAEGTVTGLRIDHPDGLYDPTGYFRRLQLRYALLLARQLGAEGPQLQALGERFEAESQRPDSPFWSPLFIVAEKILVAQERIPQNWAIHGTTGYDFLSVLNGLFVSAGNGSELARIYATALGRRLDFEALVTEKRRITVGSAMASEFQVLARRLNRLSEMSRRTRDFTLSSLTQALLQFTAYFPVYRTYVDGRSEGVDERDAQILSWTIERARSRSLTLNASIFDFLERILLKRYPRDLGAVEREAQLAFILKLQQLTGPVMAKSVEDTAFYIYNRLVSLNEVGCEPEHFGSSVASFHAQNGERAQRFPHSLLATSTHDTKRSEDVRVRIDALSEVPQEWERHLMRWKELNRAHLTAWREQESAPDSNDEILLYETLLGTWPLGKLEEPVYAEYRQRIENYLLKAAHEAKVHTSWVNLDPHYDGALKTFVRRVLPEVPPRPGENPFWDDFLPFQEKLRRAGLFSALSQTLLKNSSPGVPDLYQGCELWDFSLVDPDNRRPVDYALRQRLLAELKEWGAGDPARRLGLAAKLLGDPSDPRLKLYVSQLTLRLRCDPDSPLEGGDYRALEVQGSRADHLVAFQRTRKGKVALTVAPRLWLSLLGDEGHWRDPADVWGTTSLSLPPSDTRSSYRDLFTGRQLVPKDGKLLLADALAAFPVALLEA